jgi:hypothetical protein
MLCNRCGHELPADTPVCSRCGPVTLGGGFAPTVLSPSAPPPLAMPPPLGAPSPPWAAPPASPAPPATPDDPMPAAPEILSKPAIRAPAVQAPTPSAKQARKQRAREAMAARAAGDRGEEVAARAEDDVPLSSFEFVRPRAVSLLAGADLLLGIANLTVTWATATGRLPLGGGAGAPTSVEKAVIQAVLGLVMIAAAVGLLTLQPLGRYAQFLIAVVTVFSGVLTAIAGIAMVVYLARSGVRILFSGREPRTLTADERSKVQKETPSPLLLPAAAVFLGLLGILRLAMVLTAIQL